MGRLIVITGGPSAGKTSLIDALNSAGFATMPESGRAVIIEQRAAQGEALPWRDPQAYVEMQLDRDSANHAAAVRIGGDVFFDRGVPDLLGYLDLIGETPTRKLAEAARQLRYVSPVFLAPFWEEIYERDSERTQSPAEAERTCAAVKRAYRDLGYAIVELPKASIGRRMEFMRKTLAAL